MKLLTHEVVSGVEEAAGGVMVRNNRGTTIEGDAVVIGIGIDPNVELALSAGLDVGNGILVDQFCRTSIDRIYAAGDVSNHYHPLFGRNLRVEHYDNALRQGIVAARNMLGHMQSYDPVHCFLVRPVRLQPPIRWLRSWIGRGCGAGSINERNFVPSTCGPAS